jgi:DNA-3-methyladenine glycosylase II
VLDERTFAQAVGTLCAADPGLAGIVERHGIPSFWARDPGLPTLVLIVLEQQVSLASARAAFDRLERRLGVVDAGGLRSSSDAELRSDGFSRQKAGYVRALAAAVDEGRVDLEGIGGLPDDDVRRALTALPGIGPWTAEVYLLSALRRPDTWPVGDIALQEATRRVLGLEERPSQPELEAIGEGWRPHRATAARLLWHLYLSEPRRPARPPDPASPPSLSPSSP